MCSFLRRFHRAEEGTVAIIVAILLVVLLGFAALAIDMSHGYATQTELQVTASAGALAGAGQITDANEDGVDDTNQYRRGAVEFVYRNMAPLTHGNLVQAVCGAYDPVSGTGTGGNECSDVKLGNWDPGTRIFTAWDAAGFDPATMDLDAVRVRAHRSQANGNPLRLYIAPVLGYTEMDIDVSAIAWAAGQNELDCYRQGIIAGGLVDMDSDNTYTDALCVYGDEGVKYQTGNCFQGPDEACGEGYQDPGTQVMVPDPSLWDEGGGPNPGMEDAKAYGVKEPELAQQVAAFIDAVDVGFASAEWIAEGYNYEEVANPNVDGFPVTTMPTDALEPNTVYEISGTADIPEGDWTNVAIKADKIVLKPLSSLTNAILMAANEIALDGNVYDSVLASGNLIKIGSNQVIGGTACDAAGITVVMYAQGEFTIGSTNQISNTQLVTGYAEKIFNLQSNNTYKGVNIESMGDIALGSNNTYSGCPPGDSMGPQGEISGLVVRLVD